MILKGQHIIIFSQMRSTDYEIAKLLSKENKVYYIDRPYTWVDYLKLRNTKTFKERKPRLFSSDKIMETDTPDLKIIVTPLALSINMLPEGKLYRAALKFNEMMIGKRINSVLKKDGVTNFIYINSYNFSYPTLHKLLNPTLSVYRCVDPLIEPYQTKHGLISEDIVVQQVDLVISTSQELSNVKSRLNKNSFFIPNAANIKHSQKALDPNLPVADILSGIKKPVIGYFGAIERRIDYELVMELVKANSDKNFVFVGPVDTYYVNPENYKAPNLIFKDPVPYDLLPAVLKGFDVAIIPFKRDEVSRNIFPLKLFEYLGSGRPVVATNFNDDLKDFTGETVTYCKNEAEFSIAIETALKDTPELKQKRLAVAADNTWEHRTEQLEELLKLNLDKKLARA